MSSYVCMFLCMPEGDRDNRTGIIIWSRQIENKRDKITVEEAVHTRACRLDWFTLPWPSVG